MGRVCPTGPSILGNPKGRHRALTSSPRQHHHVRVQNVRIFGMGRYGNPKPGALHAPGTALGPFPNVRIWSARREKQRQEKVSQPGNDSFEVRIVWTRGMGAT